MILVQYCECFRAGNLEGLFITTQEALDTIEGVELHFGEVLGKHSEVEWTPTYKIVSTDLAFIEDMRRVFGTDTICGYNPFDYIPEPDEQEDEE